MHRHSHLSAFITVVLGGALSALVSGCAHELSFSDSGSSSTANLASLGEHADINTPRSPSAVCDQYLALLSEERLESARPRYGSGSDCWSGDSAQYRQCESECRSNVYNLIKGSLATMEAEKQERERNGQSAQDE